MVAPRCPLWVVAMQEQCWYRSRAASSWREAAAVVAARACGYHAELQSEAACSIRLAHNVKRKGALACQQTCYVLYFLVPCVVLRTAGGLWHLLQVPLPQRQMLQRP